MKPLELIDSYRQNEGQRKMLNMILDLDKNSKIQKVGNPRRKLENNIMHLQYPLSSFLTS